jgi:nucleoside-diphosphate-sugar epimerase
MPSVTSGKVLVSGASGFIAAWVCKSLLEEGFSVRGTVRTTKKGEFLKKLFQEYGDRFEYVIVEDMEKVSGFVMNLFEVVSNIILANEGRCI